MTDAPAAGAAMWLPVAAAIFLISLAVYSLRRREVPGALPLTAGALFGALWLLGLSMVAASYDAATMLFWHRFQAAWPLPSITAMTCFALEYAQPGRWLSRRNLLVLSVLPLVVGVAVFLPASSLVWQTLQVTPDGQVSVEYSGSGRLLVAYGVGLFLVNLVAYGWLFVRSPAHRGPVVVLLVGTAAARVLFVLATAQSVAAVPARALVVAAIALVWALYAVALFAFRILDPLGAARQTVIRQMREGMIVFDNRWRVVSANPAGETILQSPAARLRGKTWQEVMASAEARLDPDRTVTGADLLAPSEITLGRGENARRYALDLSPLKDQRGLRAGSLLLLLDITEQRRAQAQAQEQQQMLAVIRERERLARELHDNLGQVIAFVNTQGQAARRVLARGDIATADAQLARLIEVAQEADTDVRESILGLRVAMADRGLLPALAEYLTQYQRRYGIETSLVATGVADGAFEPSAEAQLLRIAQEALANARKHGKAGRVRVSIDVCDEVAVLAIEDDGCGFDARGAAVDGRVGLRVMNERAEEVGAALSVESGSGRGTRVAVTIPLRGDVASDRGGQTNARAAG
jgi:signal transduction histidine kinase